MERDLLCGHQLDGDATAVRVEGEVGTGRSRLRDFLICSSCWRPGPSYRLLDDVMVMGLYRGVEPVSGACEGCGVPVLRGADPRLQMVTCSKSCTTKASKARHATTVSPAVTKCACCGAGLEGRSDRRYCSSGCRQRAYRTRQTTLS